MRVLVATHNYPRFPGDPAGAFVARLARGLAAAGDDVLAVAPHAPGLPEREEDGQVAVRRFRYAPETQERLAYTGHLHEGAGDTLRAALLLPFFLRAFRRALRHAAATFPPELLHAHWWAPAGWCALGVDVPLVVTCHGTDVTLLERSALVRRMGERVLTRADAVTTVSAALARRLGAALPAVEGHVQVIRMPLDIAHFAAGGVTPKARPARILYAGNLTALKGVDVLVRAVARLRAERREVTLRILGAGPEHVRLLELARSLELGHAVEILPFVGQEAMPSEYGAATVTVLPTRGDAEGLGLALAEALLAGCAVIGSPSGGIPEVVVDEETGLLFRDGDDEHLARQLARLLDDEPLRRRLTEAGAARVRAAHDPAAATARFRALFEDVRARRAR